MLFLILGCISFFVAGAGLISGILAYQDGSVRSALWGWFLTLVVIGFGIFDMMIAVSKLGSY